MPRPHRIAVFSTIAALGIACGPRAVTPPIAPPPCPSTAATMSPPPAAEPAPKPSVSTPSLALGDAHTCASLVSQGVWCWGKNNHGQLGDGTRTSRRSPVRVFAEPVSTLAAGGDHTCADAHCWGRNTNGQLGDGTRIDRDSPVTPSALLNGAPFEAERGERWLLNASGSCLVQPQESGYWARCSTPGIFPHASCKPPSFCTEWFTGGAGRGDNLCISRAGYGGHTTGSIRCAHDDDHLGRPITPPEDPPPLGGTLQTLLQFTLGKGFACGVQLDGRIVCWGDLSGLRGTGSHKPETLVSGYWSARSVVAGDRFACFIRADEHVLCFGSEPALGLPTGPHRGLGEPRLALDQVSPMVTLGAGPRHVCAATYNDVFCWGKNDDGQLGDGTTTDRPAPVPVPLPK
ncbi:BNR repeat domain protein [Minicystis rosea]|nr:BNR repeat domain protein [Minicystis rosea]